MNESTNTDETNDSSREKNKSIRRKAFSFRFTRENKSKSKSKSKSNDDFDEISSIDGSSTVNVSFVEFDLFSSLFNVEERKRENRSTNELENENERINDFPFSSILSSIDD